ncbi:MAG: DUF3137 domain-containing protein [Acholeplasmataceae bacterium]
MNFKTIIQRKKTLESYTVVGVVLLIVSFILFIPTRGVSGVTFLIGMLLAGFSSNKLKKISVEYKETYLAKHIKELIPEAVYKPKEGFDSDFIINSGILKKEDRIASEDYLSGVILDYPFRSADVHLQDVRSDGKTTSVVTVFQGRLFEIKVTNKSFRPLYIMPNKTSRFGHLRRMEKIDLEMITFNKTFDLFCEDKHFAFKLLTPRMMEKIMEFNELHPKVRIGFDQNRIMVAIDTRIDTFDLRMFKPVDDPIALIQKEIDFLTVLIQEIIQPTTRKKGVES